MKERIILRVKRWLHYRGFIIERIPDDKKLDEELHLVDEAGKRHILKKLTSNIGLADNHTRYNTILRKYVPSWNWNVSYATFVGFGIGEYSFNTFRRVLYEGRWFFEKIYFNNTYDLAKIEWFYEHVFPLLIDQINLTKLHRIIKGQIFTIVYFDYTELTSLPESDANDRALYFSRTLHRASISFPITELCTNSPAFLKDYRSHFGYKRNIVVAAEEMERLTNGSLSPKSIEEIVDVQPVILTHGDIQKANIYADNYLIDWDSFGFFPIGFEAACILFERNEIVDFTQLNEVVGRNYRLIVGESNWIEYQLCCFYFYFIFISVREKTPELAVLKEDVLKEIEYLYQTALGRI